MTIEVENLLRQRLTEFAEEEHQLRRVLLHLSPNGHLRAPRRRKSTALRGGTSSPRRGKRAAPGERRRQLVDAIKEMPGASPNELADAIGVVSTQVYGMVRSLEAKSEIKKKGQGFVIVDRAS
jgi:hypothetical protein